MADTDRLVLPLIASEQAQKHVTHNEAILSLDGLVQLSLEVIDMVSPPGSPVAGACYGIGSGATGDWTGHDGEIAQWTDAGWRFHTPQQGWHGFDAAGGRLVVHDGSDWADDGYYLGAVQNLALLGINGTADASNKLTAVTNGVLFGAVEVADGGTGDLRLALNKESSSDISSLVFQTGYSGRAEIGTVGDDGLVVRVSADGSSFATGLTIAAGTGFVTHNQVFGAEPSFPVVASGVLAVTTSFAIPEPETGTSDTIDTISGGFDGALLILSGTVGNALTFGDGTGNLKLGASRVLDNFEDSLMLVRRGTDWIELAYADNG